ELNQTFTSIVKEAQAHADATTHEPNPETAKLAVARPRYQRARLLGEQPVHGLAKRYLKELSQTLRPGTTKSIRYALELLSSHVGKKQKIGELSTDTGRDIIKLISKLSPNVRKYAEAKEASLTKLVELSQTYEAISLTPQTQGRIFKQMQRFLDWCVREGELEINPWVTLSIREKPEVSPHGVLTDEQVSILLKAKDRVLHSVLLFGLLTGMRSGEICGLLAEDITAKGNLGRFIRITPNAIRQLKSKAAAREIPLHQLLEQLLDTSLPKQGRLFSYLTVDAVVKRYAKLRRIYPELQGSVFHSTRKWFITQCERTGTPEHFTASLVGHHSARSANKLTYGLYSAGISDAQKREIVDGVKLPD
ncbi:tyrosine-type recombinase/integrase, partial [Paracoccaceae bacterium]|nr:tyrosine-type recombinase/integrase [Paracoccaceae bacterium]